MEKTLTNQEIVELLRNVAAALSIKDENHFRIIAYEKAADSIEHLTSEVKDIWDEGKLREIPGVGSIIAQHLDELFRTGKIKHFENIFKGLSPAIFKLLQIPGIGPKKAHRLTKEFRIINPKTAVFELEKAAKTGKIAKLTNFGDKSQAEILSAIESYKKGQIKENRMALPYADILASELIEYLQNNPKVKQVDCLGSLRRKVATIGDIDLAVATIEGPEVINYFLKYPKIRKIIDRGDKGATVLLSIGRQVDLRVQHPNSYGSMLQYFTGSKNHNIHLRELAIKKGLSLSEHGIKKLRNVQSLKFKNQIYNKKLNLYEFSREEDFYRALGLEWIPPEIREDTGEIEAAHRQAQSKQPGLPKLVELSDIKGDLHIHSNYDLKPSHDLGDSSLEELLENAVKFNYQYIGISDHNPSISNHTDQQIIDIIKRRREKFEQLYSSWKNRVKNRVHLLHMLEIDISPTGKLSLPEQAFDTIDAAIVSIHSSFKMTKDEMTNRIISGLTHPKAKILAHPTGRLIGDREGYEANWEKIFEFVVKNRKAIEINSWPQRLDLPDLLVRQAVKMNVKIVINTDSHQKDQMFNMKYGVDVARRGWTENKDILNTMAYNDFYKWLKS